MLSSSGARLHHELFSLFAKRSLSVYSHTTGMEETILQHIAFDIFREYVLDPVRGTDIFLRNNSDTAALRFSRSVISKESSNWGTSKKSANSRKSGNFSSTHVFHTFSAYELKIRVENIVVENIVVRVENIVVFCDSLRKLFHGSSIC